MCGRYHFSCSIMDEIRDMTEEADWKLDLGLMDKDIHPGDIAPVIVSPGGMVPGVPVSPGSPEGEIAGTEARIQNDSGKYSGLIIRKQRWGFTAPDGKGLIFNARSESVFEKRMFRESVSHRRAAIPVSWFYEWNKSKEKFTFTRADSRVLFLAGFYSRYEDGDHFVILTTEANSSMSMVHSRMPLVLEKDQVKDWILKAERTRELLSQVPMELLRDCEYEQQTLF